MEQQLICNLSSIKFTEKPAKNTTGMKDISKSIANNIFIGTCEEFRDKILNGHAFLPHVNITDRLTDEIKYRSNLPNVLFSQFVVLDIDKAGFSLFRLESLKFFPFFIYETFSSTPNHRKYRLVYKFETPVTDIRIYKMCLIALKKFLKMVQNNVDYTDNIPVTKWNQFYLGTTPDKLVSFDPEYNLNYHDLLYEYEAFISFNAICSKRNEELVRKKLFEEIGVNPDMPFISVKAKDVPEEFLPKMPEGDIGVDLDTVNHQDLRDRAVTKYIYSNSRVPHIPVNLKRSDLLYSNDISGYLNNLYQIENENYTSIYFWQNTAKNDTEKLEKPSAYGNFVMKNSGDLSKDEIEYMANIVGCKVFEKFNNRIDMSHDDRAILYVALRSYKNGKKLYNDYKIAINQKYDNIPYGFRDHTIPKCCTACKHPGSVFRYLSSYKTLKKTRYSSIRVVSDKNYNTIENVRTEFTDKLQNVLDNPDKKIHIFKVDTGTGKTHIALDILYNMIHNNNSNHKIIFASSLHNKLDEIFSENRWKYSNKVFRWERLPKFIRSHHLLELEYIRNSHKSILSHLSKIAVHYKKHERDKIYKYIDKNKKINVANNIFTTHHKSIHLLEKSNKTIVYDETPEDQLFNIKSVSIKEVNKIINNYISSDNLYLKEMATHLKNLMFNMQAGVVINNEKISINISNLFTELESYNNKLKTPVFDVLSCDYVVFPEKTNFVDSDILYIVNKVEIPEDKTIIILSATPNIETYKALYGDRVELHESDSIKNMGKIYQDTSRSYSKYSVMKNPVDFKNINSFIKKHNIEVVLTSKLIETKNKLEVNEINHFFNIEGLNEYSGKNILILGTPNPPVSVIKLHLKAKGIDVNSINFTMKKQKVEFDGLEFTFYTYENEDAKSIYLHLISSEILQAIGRSRLIHNNCNVFLMSTFPIYGANFVDFKDANFITHTITDEYIDLINDPVINQLLDEIPDGESLEKQLKSTNIIEFQIPGQKPLKKLLDSR